MASWEDDESLYDEDLGGGVYYDPKSGKYYAEETYKYRGGRKGLFGGRRKKTGYDLIELDESELEAFGKYREGRSEYARGRKGRKAYSGPGRNVGDKAFVEQMGKAKGAAGPSMSAYTIGATLARQQSEKYEKEVAKRIKDYSSWWEKERASGERGAARVQELKAKGQATQAMRSRYASGRGWGS